MHEQSTEKKHSTMLPRAIKPSLTHFRPTYKTVGGNNLDSFFFFFALKSFTDTTSVKQPHA